MSEYTDNDWREYLAHSWGKKPEQKKAEKKYNREYWLEHRKELLKKMRERYLRLRGKKLSNQKIASEHRLEDAFKDVDKKNSTVESGSKKNSSAWLKAYGSELANVRANGGYDPGDYETWKTNLQKSFPHLDISDSDAREVYDQISKTAVAPKSTAASSSESSSSSGSSKSGRSSGGSSGSSKSGGSSGSSSSSKKSSSSDDEKESSSSSKKSSSGSSKKSSSSKSSSSSEKSSENSDNELSATSSNTKSASANKKVGMIGGKSTQVETKENAMDSIVDDLDDPSSKLRSANSHIFDKESGNSPYYDVEKFGEYMYEKGYDFTSEKERETAWKKFKKKVDKWADAQDEELQKEYEENPDEWYENKDNVTKTSEEEALKDLYKRFEKMDTEDLNDRHQNGAYGNFLEFLQNMSELAYFYKDEATAKKAWRKFRQTVRPSTSSKKESSDTEEEEEKEEKKTKSTSSSKGLKYKTAT